jgi:hypothetical protein
VRKVASVLQTGRRFGSLRVVRQIRRWGKYNYKILCQCDCGALHRVIRFSLLNGETTSCGCFQRSDLAIRNKGNAHGVTHGATKADASPALKRTYSSWKAAVQRTTNPKANRGRDWHRYGGCGVTVCEGWLHSFKNFLADLGERPAGTTLGRYGDIGNYEPGRCAWQTPAQQAAESNNRRERS